MSAPPGTYGTLDEMLAASEPAPAPASDQGAPFVSQTQPPLINFTPQGGPSISLESKYITASDAMQLFVRNSNPAITSMTAQLRILRPDGTVITEIITVSNVPADRTSENASVALQEGFLMGALVGPPGVNNSRGQTFVRLVLMRNIGGPLQFNEQLIADYLETTYSPSWPQGPTKPPLEPPGFVYNPTDGVPVLGTEATVTQPAATLWLLRGLFVQLITDGAAGNRLVAFRLFSGGTQVAILVSPVAQPPGTDYTYTVGINLPNAQVSPGIITLAMPDDLKLLPGFPLTTNTSGLDGGDRYTSMIASVEEWISV